MTAPRFVLALVAILAAVPNLAAPCLAQDYPTKPIRMIVKNTHVTLEGSVDSETDKQLAHLQSTGVKGVASVTNHLRVEKRC